MKKVLFLLGFLVAFTAANAQLNHSNSGADQITTLETAMAQFRDTLDYGDNQYRMNYPKGGLFNQIALDINSFAFTNYTYSDIANLFYYGVQGKDWYITTIGEWEARTGIMIHNHAYIKSTHAFREDFNQAHKAHWMRIVVIRMGNVEAAVLKDGCVNYLLGVYVKPRSENQNQNLGNDNLADTEVTGRVLDTIVIEHSYDTTIYVVYTPEETVEEEDDYELYPYPEDDNDCCYQDQGGGWFPQQQGGGWYASATVSFPPQQSGGSDVIIINNNTNTVTTTCDGDCDDDEPVIDDPGGPEDGGDPGTDDDGDAEDGGDPDDDGGPVDGGDPNDGGDPERFGDIAKADAGTHDVVRTEDSKLKTAEGKAGLEEKKLPSGPKVDITQKGLEEKKNLPVQDLERKNLEGKKFPPQEQDKVRENPEGKKYPQDNRYKNPSSGKSQGGYPKKSYSGSGNSYGRGGFSKPGGMSQPGARKTPSGKRG